MNLSWPPLDPDEVLDYGADWTDPLAGDTIALSAFTVPVGLTKQSEANTATTATVWLTGGTLGQNYEILNRVTTAGGRVMDETFRLAVRRK